MNRTYLRTSAVKTDSITVFVVDLHGISVRVDDLRGVERLGERVGRETQFRLMGDNVPPEMDIPFLAKDWKRATIVSDSIYVLYPLEFLIDPEEKRDTVYFYDDRGRLTTYDAVDIRVVARMNQGFGPRQEHVYISDADHIYKLGTPVLHVTELGGDTHTYQMENLAYIRLDGPQRMHFIFSYERTVA